LGLGRGATVLRRAVRGALSFVLAAPLRREGGAGGRAVKLGLSQACYRWVFYPPLRRDTPAYALTAERLPYYSTIPASLQEEGAPGWLIEGCSEMEMAYLHVTTGLLRDERRASELRAHAADRGVRLIGAASANWVARGDEWRRDRDRYVAAMPIAV